MSRENYDDLNRTEAVEFLGKGVETSDLIQFMDLFYDRVVSRVEGTGADQYEDKGSQKFESMSVDELADELLDELADTWAYIAFIAVHIMATVRSSKP